MQDKPKRGKQKMAIIVNSKPAGPPKEYPLPAEVMNLIVLADVEDLGVQQNEYYGARKEVRLTWVLNQKDPEGNYFVIGRNYTSSLNEKSNLYADVKDMIGKVPPEEMDIEGLIGTVNQGVIKHSPGKKGTKNEGKTFANIKAFLAPRPGETFAVPKDFVRGKDGGKFGKLLRTRDNQPQHQSRTTPPVQKASTATQAPVQQVADEDIPF